MAIKLTRPQADLLRDLQKAGTNGIFKSKNYTPAEMLVSDGMAKWAQSYHNGTGKLVVTEKGMQFGGLK